MDASEHIGLCALRALLHESSVTPKPGLVCPDDSGAHTDMDIRTFVSGALSLGPYFTLCARHGADSAALPPEEAFSGLRRLGIEAEQAMFRATRGVNTHKGLIFSLGLLCAAAGRLRIGADVSADKNPADRLCETAAEFVRGITARDFAPLLPVRASALDDAARLEAGAAALGRPLSAGERLFVLHGTGGAREEAERGFPHVLAAGRAFGEWLRDHDFNSAAVNTVLLLMTDAEDTNALTRGGRSGLAMLRENARTALEYGGWTTEKGKNAVRRLCETCRARNISPGGSADMLALVLFLHFIEHTLRE